MNTKGRSKTALLLAGLLVGLTVATDAFAQTPYANAILYEIRESINCNPGGTTTPLADPLCQAEAANGFGTRIADATLVGVPPSFGGVAGPSEFTGSITIDASSVLSKVDWTGPIHGKFTVQNVLGKTVTGTLSGQLDLSLLTSQNIPLAPVSGHWSGTKGTLKASGTFAGVFLLPFCIPSAGCFYLELDATGQPTGGVVQLAATEYVTVPGIGPVPLVKLLVTLFTK